MLKQITLFPAYGPVDFPDIVEKAVSFISKRAPGAFLKGGGVGSAGVGKSESKTFAGSISKPGSW